MHNDVVIIGKYEMKSSEIEKVTKNVTDFGLGKGIRKSNPCRCSMGNNAFYRVKIGGKGRIGGKDGYA